MLIHPSESQKQYLTEVPCLGVQAEKCLAVARLKPGSGFKVRRANH